MGFYDFRKFKYKWSFFLTETEESWTDALIKKEDFLIITIQEQM